MGKIKISSLAFYRHPLHRLCKWKWNESASRSIGENESWKHLL